MVFILGRNKEKTENIYINNNTISKEKLDILIK